MDTRVEEPRPGCRCQKLGCPDDEVPVDYMLAASDDGLSGQHQLLDDPCTRKVAAPPELSERFPDYIISERPKYLLKIWRLKVLGDDFGKKVLAEICKLCYERECRLRIGFFLTQPGHDAIGRAVDGGHGTDLGAPLLGIQLINAD